MSRRLRLFLGYCGGLTVAGALFAGCGGISPGDYKVYRLAVTQEDLSTGCYYPDGVPLNEKSDSSTFRDTQTVILYAAVEDKFYLNTGKKALEGTADGDKYTFEGKTVDVNYDSPDGTGNKRTDTTTITVEFTVDGSSVTGTETTKVSHKCSGQSCGNPIPSCTHTVEFVGTEVDDVELDYSVAESPNNPTGDDVSAGPTGDSAGPTSGPSGTGGSSSTSSVSSSSASGTGGSGGSCATCNDILAGTVVMGEQACAASQTIVNDLFTCGCSPTCSSACSSMCSTGMPDATCESCMSEACSSQYFACQDDI